MVTAQALTVADLVRFGDLHLDKDEGAVYWDDKRSAPFRRAYVKAVQDEVIKLVDHLRDFKLSDYDISQLFSHQLVSFKSLHQAGPGAQLLPIGPNAAAKARVYFPGKTMTQAYCKDADATQKRHRLRVPGYAIGRLGGSTFTAWRSMNPTLKMWTPKQQQDAGEAYYLDDSSGLRLWTQALRAACLELYNVDFDHVPTKLLSPTAQANRPLPQALFPVLPDPEGSIKAVPDTEEVASVDSEEEDVVEGLEEYVNDRTQERGPAGEQQEPRPSTTMDFGDLQFKGPMDITSATKESTALQARQQPEQEQQPEPAEGSQGTWASPDPKHKKKRYVADDDDEEAPQQAIDFKAQAELMEARALGQRPPALKAPVTNKMTSRQRAFFIDKV